MKSVLISIQPFWVFLIIAKTMGWSIDKEKTVEVRKNYPKGNDWNKVVKIYCSKDKKSFAKIPKEYQPLMERFLGKVIGEFVCNSIGEVTWCSNVTPSSLKEFYNEETCLTDEEVWEYTKGKSFYEWYISDFVIYDKPRELSEFKKHNRTCYYDHLGLATPKCKECKGCQITRPPQSWCYVESEGDTK